MDPNPYRHPQTVPEHPASAQLCVRRIDITIIAIAIGALFIVSIIAIASPPVREWFMPRFGWTAGLTLFPLNFLCLYLWKPAPRLLLLASVMFFVAAALNAAKIAVTGTVPVVSNVFNDRLPSAYLWSVFGVAIIGVYVAYVAWDTRKCVTTDPAKTQDGG